jgi:hypothetical protein
MYAAIQTSKTASNAKTLLPRTKKSSGHGADSTIGLKKTSEQCVCACVSAIAGVVRINHCKRHPETQRTGKEELGETSSLKKELVKTQTTEKDTRRAMQKEIRALKKMVANMKMSEDSSDTDEDSESEDSEDNQPVDTQPSPGILYRYQKLKNYMVKSNRSLGSLTRFQPDKHSLLDNFLNIKYRRLAVAHPKTDSFEDDEEFADALRQ